MNAEPATVTADPALPALRRDGWFFICLATGAFALSGGLYWLAKGDETQTNPVAILAVLMVSGAAFCFAYAALKFGKAFRAGAQSLPVIAPLIISASLGGLGLAVLAGRRLFDNTSVQAGLISAPAAVLLAFLVLWPAIWRLKLRLRTQVLALGVLTLPIFWLLTTLFELHAQISIPLERRGQYSAFWSGAMPDVFRPPIAALAKRILPKFKSTAYETGWLPLAMLKAAALDPNSATLAAWAGWERRDQAGVLAYSLTVAPVADIAVTATPWDSFAGTIIGKYAPAGEIAKRLNGEYSDRMLDGLYMGVFAKTRAGEINEFAARQIEADTSPPPPRGKRPSNNRTLRLWQFVAADQAFLEKFLLRHFAGRTTESKRVIEQWTRFPGFYRMWSSEAIALALSCENATARQWVLTQLPRLPNVNKHVWRSVAVIAAGEIAEADNPERITALRCLGRLVPYPAQVDRYYQKPFPPEILGLIATTVQDARAKIEAMKE